MMMNKGAANPANDGTPFLGEKTVGDIHSIVADFVRRNLRKRGYKEWWIGGHMDELMQEMWCEIQKCKPKLVERENWRAYILTAVSNYLKGWCMNNPHGSYRPAVWTRTMAESTKKKWALYHASIPESSWTPDGATGDEPPSIFQGSDDKRQEVSELLLDIRAKIEDPITRAIVLLKGSGYSLVEIRRILAPVFNVSHQAIFNRLKKGRRLLA